MIAALALARRLPRPVWRALAGAALLLLLWHWHNRQLAAARAAGASAQAVADARAVARATAAAMAAQQALKQALAARQSRITQGTDNALRSQNDDLARRYDALRLRWAAYRADSGRPGAGGTAALPTTAGGADATACAARGWVSFDIAATAAQAADTAIARDDAWRAWVTAQQAAWPD